ncbi:gfo/Idh/MocA family oxidoreductase, partial [Candidatus Micrarchaeota archaeon CG_4_10_14_0_2_um_filter_55_9]
MVVGAGAMGRHHVRVLNELQEVKRVVVVEPSEKARHAVEERGFEKTFFYGDLDEAL